MRTFVTVPLLIGSALAASIPRAPISILVGNDDGWATANIRALYNTLASSGYNTIISAPAENKSGSSSIDLPPSPIGSGGGQFGSIPPNSPATGSDPSDPRINYVNSFPVTGVKHGIMNLAPQFFGGKPDLVVTGPNVGSNLGLVNWFSGTVGAAREGALQGIPSIAFSGAGGTQHSHTQPDSTAPVYAELAKKVVDAVIAGGRPYLPEKIILNVNFPKTSAQCANASDFKFVLSRVILDVNPFTDDVQHCGTNHLPRESSVVGTDGCYVSISVMDTKDKLDVGKDIQKQVRDKISGIFSCLP